MNPRPKIKDRGGQYVNPKTLKIILKEHKKLKDIHPTTKHSYLNSLYKLKKTKLKYFYLLFCYYILSYFFIKVLS